MSLVKVEIPVNLYYHRKGAVNLDFEGRSSWSFELKERLSEIRIGILSLFGGETRDLTRDEVLNIVTPALVRYLPPVRIRIKFLYFSEPAYFREMVGWNTTFFSRKTRFERMLV